MEPKEGAGAPPCDMPSWPCDIGSIAPISTSTNFTYQNNNTSEPFITLVHLALDRQKYLDSLIPPSSEQIVQIAGLQAIKEAENKRRDRIHRRIASEASLQRYRNDTFGCIQNYGVTSLNGDGHGHNRGSSFHISSHAGVINPHCPSTGTARSSSPVGNNSVHLGIGGNAYNANVAPIIQQHLYHNHGHSLHGGGLAALPGQAKPIDASTRWTQAIREVRFRILTAPRSRNGITPDIARALPPGFIFNDDNTNHSDLLRGLLKPLSARQRWKKAIAVACRAGFDSHAASSSSPDKNQDEDYQSELEYMSSLSSPSDSASDSDSDSDRERSKKAKKELKKVEARCKQEAKIINELYLLELVDVKHRYGLNLFVYYQVWKKSPTTPENFFYWLDYGEGRFLDLTEGGCPREKLEREQIRYLSPEEQQLYLVVVGSGGRLCWAKNGLPVDTDSTKWRDSVAGIVAVDDPAEDYRSPWLESGMGMGSTFSSPCSSGDNSRIGSSWSTDSAYATSLTSAPDHRDRSLGTGDNLRGRGDTATTTPKEIQIKRTSKNSKKAYKKLKYGNTPATWLIDKFIRRQWGEKPWIFVADSAGRLYIGIKDNGSFQHTSFTRGSRVSAAGMISVREGKVTGLSPLSGHYRPPTRNFRAFVERLKSMGVDLGSASNSPAPTATASPPGAEKRPGRGLGREMRICYGKDYWLLRGFEIYSDMKKVFGSGVSDDDDDGSKEVIPNAGETRRRFLSVKRRKPLFVSSRTDNTAIGKPCVEDGEGAVGDLEINSMSSRPKAEPTRTTATQKMALRNWWRARSASMPDIKDKM